jgi:hypothetical protein
MPKYFWAQFGHNSIWGAGRIGLANVHRAAGVIVDHALRITAEHRFAPSTLLDLAVSFADFFPLRTK